jgi:hypothetical protein
LAERRTRLIFSPRGLSAVFTGTPVMRLQRSGFTLFLALAIAACSRDAGLSPASGDLSASPTALDLGDVSLCAPTEATVTVTNSSRSGLFVEVPDAPEWVVAEPSRLPVPGSGAASIRLRFAPASPGLHQASFWLADTLGRCRWTSLNIDLASRCE